VWGGGIRGLKTRGCLFALLVARSSSAPQAGAQASTRARSAYGHITFSYTFAAAHAVHNGNCSRLGPHLTVPSGIPVGHDDPQFLSLLGRIRRAADTLHYAERQLLQGIPHFAATYVAAPDPLTPSALGVVCPVTVLHPGNGTIPLAGLTVNYRDPFCNPPPGGCRGVRP